MASSPSPSVPPTEDLEAFTVRVLRYLDGQSSAEEVQQLKVLLSSKAAHRNVFVQVCRLHGYLYEAFAPRRPAEPARLPALAGQAGGEATRVSEASSIPGPELSGGDALVGPELVVGPPDHPDVGADTMLGELSGEDTLHRTPKPPET
jgi:hypothetical protein